MLLPAVSFAPNAHATLLSLPPTTIIHVEDPTVCANNAAAPVQALSARYPSGNRVSPNDEVPYGTQLTIEALLSAHCYRTQNENGNYQFTALMEVRDSDGITQYLAVQQGEIVPWTESSFAISWVPETPGEYEIRAFSLGDLHNSGVLSQVVTIRITVV